MNDLSKIDYCYCIICNSKMGEDDICEKENCDLSYDISHDLKLIYVRYWVGTSNLIIGNYESAIWDTSIHNEFQEHQINVDGKEINKELMISEINKWIRLKSLL